MKKLTAKELNEISSLIMHECHNVDYGHIELMAGYFEAKLFGPDNEQWSISQLKKRLKQYDTALRSFKQNNGHYSNSEQSYHNYIGRLYPIRPNDQVMVFRMRIGDYMPDSVKAGGHRAVHKYLKEYHQAFIVFRIRMETLAKQWLKESVECVELTAVM